MSSFFTVICKNNNLFIAISQLNHWYSTCWLDKSVWWSLIELQGNNTVSHLASREYNSILLLTIVIMQARGMCNYIVVANNYCTKAWEQLGKLSCTIYKTCLKTCIAVSANNNYEFAVLHGILYTYNNSIATGYKCCNMCQLLMIATPCS